MTPNELRELLTREPIAEAVCQALNEKDDALAGYLIRAGANFLPAYKVAELLTTRLDQLQREVDAAGQTP